MKLVIDHTECGHAGAYADLCLAKTMLEPLRHERMCLAELEEDEREELTVTLREKEGVGTLVLSSEEEIKAAAYEGWVAFKPLVKPN